MMRRRSIRGGVLVALALGLSGCAGLLASPSEYAAYRATRVEETFEGRLAAAGAYLGRYPKGNFAPQVRAYLARAEPVYYATKRESIAGLEAYLRVLPSGAFAGEAGRKLRELRRARPEGDSVSVAVVETTERLDAEQRERQAVRDAVEAWVSRFLDPKAYDRPLSEAPAEIIIPFSLSLPPPICRSNDEAPGTMRCAKLLGLPYTVKVDAESDPREATVEVAVVEDPAGRPIEVEIGGPDLFLRLEETRSVRALAADDAAARIGGISLAVDIAGAAFRKRVSADPSCKRPAVAPVVLDLACGGLHLVVRAALEPGGDDVFVVRGAPPP
jgi:hypothetical protein